MIITPDTDNHFYKIKSYTSTDITINETAYTASLCLCADTIIPHWQIDPQHLTTDNFAFVDILHPRIFLFGTGPTLHFPPKAIFEFFAQRHIGLECMTTPAACRTYNVLNAEGRSVAAGLVIA